MMENQSKATGMPQPTAAFLRERKFLMIVPVLVLPFLTMAFWAMGGGKQNRDRSASLPDKGMNFTLPQAQFKDQKAQDKMGVYQNTKTAADAAAGNGVSESFVRSMGLDTSKVKRSASSASETSADLSGPSQADINEAGVREKLAAIDRQINRPETPDKGSGEAAGAAPRDIRKMQLMMKAMNENGGGSDPEMKQLTKMLQQISDIQNPDNEISRLRNQSLKNRGRVFPVIAAGDDDADDRASGEMNVSYAFQTDGKRSGKYKRANNSQDQGNTIQAVVHENQTLVSGAVMKLRLTNAIYVNGKMIPKGSFIYGTCTLNNERLLVKITSIRYLNNILPVALSVYDLDGMEGLYVPGSIGRDAAKNGVGDAVQSMQLLSMDQSVSAQAASAGVEAAKGLFNHKVKQVKIKVKAGYEVLLKDSNDREN